MTGRIRSAARSCGGPALVAMFTPCHGARVFFEAAAVVAGAVVNAICSRCGQRWRIELTSDEAAEGGLRPTWGPWSTRSVPAAGAGGKLS
ncbi:MAG: hypothetical protein ACRD0K_09065 [Egibacteraceae bacterium]